MKNKPALADVMTKEPETVEIGQPLSEVYTLLQNRRFHHVPVIDDGVPVGLIAATDILRLVYDAEGSTDEKWLRSMLDYQFSIEDAMTVDLVSVQKGASVASVVDHMADGTVHSVIVLADDGSLAGIVTSTDLIQLLGRVL
jgi:CBS domain-containing protein